VKRESILLRGVLFAAFYGLLLVNWLDLYEKAIPSYSVFLLLLYLAPSVLILLFSDGRRTWPLAVSLALLISLFNDLGYFFVANSVFGLSHPLWPWIQGQLGFEGAARVSSFKSFLHVRFPIESWEMGASVYARFGLLAAALRSWWRKSGT
jgi:hypothetical protein